MSSEKLHEDMARSASTASLTSASPPPVEALTGVMISLFSRFAQVDQPASSTSPTMDGHTDGQNGVLYASNPMGDVSLVRTAAANDSDHVTSNQLGYKEFINKLKQVSKEHPAIVQKLTDFIQRMNSRTVLVSYPIFEDEDIPGAHEEFAPDVRLFLDQFAKELLKSRSFRDCNEDEAMSLRENLEKLVMNKLYDHCFSCTEAHRDRDRQLATKIDRLRSVLDPVKHLDMLPSLAPSESDLPAWEKAADELAKMSSFKTPRDKLICISNACRGIVQLIKANDESPIPDVFIPCLIYAITLKNPQSLHSNIEYISAYRGQEFMRGESGYYLLHLASAVSFLWRADHKALSMMPEEFENAMLPRQVQLVDTEGKEGDYSPTNGIPNNPYVENGHARDLLSGDVDDVFVYEFVSYSELKACDVPNLLKQYQTLVKEYRALLGASQNGLSSMF